MGNGADVAGAASTRASFFARRNAAKPARHHGAHANVNTETQGERGANANVNTETQG